MGKLAKRLAAAPGRRKAVKRRRPTPELPPELQDAEILGGSSDAGWSDSEEAEEPSGEVKELLRHVEAEPKAKGKAKGKAKAKAKAKVKAKAKGKVLAEAKAEGQRRDGQIYLSELPYSLKAEVLSLGRLSFGTVFR